MPSPRDVASQLKQTPEQVKYDRDIQQARREGERAGKEALRHELLTYLEKQYMSQDIKRGDKKASALLDLTRDVAQWLRNRIDR